VLESKLGCFITIYRFFPIAYILTALNIYSTQSPVKAFHTTASEVSHNIANLHPPHQSNIVFMEGSLRPKKAATVIEHWEIPNYTNSVRSTAPLLQSASSSPAIKQEAERHGSQIIPSSSKRQIHKWRSPLLMVVFYLLGLSLSVAHCIFYPKLKGRIVGDPGQQEEKIR
jgi:hypothetical protein